MFYVGTIKLAQRVNDVGSHRNLFTHTHTHKFEMVENVGSLASKTKHRNIVSSCKP